MCGARGVTRLGGSQRVSPGYTQAAQLETVAGVGSMTPEAMQEAIKHSTIGDYSPGLDGIVKPLWPALAGFLAMLITVTMQLQRAMGYILEAPDHGIRTRVPKKNRQVVSNMRPPTMLNERAKIYYTALLVSIEDMMPQLVPQQQVGFMKKRQMSLVGTWLQRI